MIKVTYGKGFELKKPDSMRSKVEALESELQLMPQVECPIRHYFSPGIYAREMSIPAGTVVTGAIHRTENLIIVSTGRLRIVTDEGTREVVAGDVVTCLPGMKNAVVAIEDSRWTNILPNPTNEKNIDALVEMYTESKASELMGGSKNSQLAQSGLMKLEK